MIMGALPAEREPKSLKGKLIRKGIQAMAAKKKNWIQDAIKKPGALREAMGAKEGKNIPKGKLAEAAKKKGVTGQRARLAQTLASFNKKKKK